MIKTYLHAASYLPTQLSHKPSRPTIAQVKRLVALVKGGRLWYFHLRPMLVERLPGTKGSRMVREVKRPLFQYRHLSFPSVLHI